MSLALIARKNSPDLRKGTGPASWLEIVFCEYVYEQKPLFDRKRLVQKYFQRIKYIITDGRSGVRSANSQSQIVNNALRRL